jgi:hypothetical protein
MGPGLQGRSTADTVDMQLGSALNSGRWAPLSLTAGLGLASFQLLGENGRERPGKRMSKS